MTENRTEPSDVTKKQCHLYFYCYIDILRFQKRFCTKRTMRPWDNDECQNEKRYTKSTNSTFFPKWILRVE